MAGRGVTSYDDHIRAHLLRRCPGGWDKDDVETAAYESLHNVPAPDPNRHYRRIWVNTMEDIGGLRTLSGTRGAQGAEGGAMTFAGFPSSSTPTAPTTPRSSTTTRRSGFPATSPAVVAASGTGRPTCRTVTTMMASPTGRRAGDRVVGRRCAPWRHVPRWDDGRRIIDAAGDAARAIWRESRSWTAPTALWLGRSPGPVVVCPALPRYRATNPGRQRCWGAREALGVLNLNHGPDMLATLTRPVASFAGDTLPRGHAAPSSSAPASSSSAVASGAPGCSPATTRP